MKKIVVFTGAGISSESGLKTFRNTDGLWENYRIEDVATHEGWKKNMKLVLDFYNERRKQVLAAKPNKAHISLAELQYYFDVHIITQNIDDLHERAGSKNVLHLHGEITKARSTKDESNIVNISGELIEVGDISEDGSQLRPHIVWFGEQVPNMELAYAITKTADIFIVIGTSLNVYPAAGITQFVPSHSEKYLIDPNANQLSIPTNFRTYETKACIGVPELVSKLIHLDKSNESK